MENSWKESLRVLSDRLRIATANLREPLNELSRFINESLSHLPKAINQTFKGLHELLEEYGKTTHRFLSIIVELGWAPHDCFLPINALKLGKIKMASKANPNSSSSC